jgi:hypothetical protein
MEVVMIESSSLGAIGAFGSFEFDLVLTFSPPHVQLKGVALLQCA